MRTRDIKTPDSEISVDKLSYIKKKVNIPNSDTLAAMEELKAGKGKQFESVEQLFNSI